MASFLDGLDADLRAALLAQFRILWTHHSTALEGNTLTLGETAFVIGEGLTVSGKSVKDHEEVIGHARAIDLLMAMLASHQEITNSHLFDLHKAVQTTVVLDIMNPIGAWKNTPNETVVVVNDKLWQNDTYALPKDVPVLMAEWVSELNRRKPCSPVDAVNDYAFLHANFVRIHPFADGNGRMARLLSNIPLLEEGYPPIVFEYPARQEYLRCLADWQSTIGPVRAGKDALTPPPESFVVLCQKTWEESLKLVAEQKQVQANRNFLKQHERSGGIER